MAQSFAFAVFATLICQINIVFPCKDTKAAKSCAFCVILLVPNSWDSYAGFLWHRALVVAQSFAFAVFATLICQINSVFPCKDTKAAKSCAFCVIRLVPNSWDSYAGFFWHRALVLRHRALSCGTELRFGIEIPLIYATAECQNLRIRLVPNSWDSYAGFL